MNYPNTDTGKAEKNSQLQWLKQTTFWYKMKQEKYMSEVYERII